MALTYFQEKTPEDGRSATLSTTPAPQPITQAAGRERNDANVPEPRHMRFFGRISLTERTVFTQNLYVMIKGGIPLAQSLGTLGAQTSNKRFIFVLQSLRQRIEKGESFSKALEAFPRYFSEVYVNMISAGEASGKLESVLHELASQLKKERILIGKIRGAMFYPALVLLAMIGIGAAMLLFVIPKITDIYRETGATLPLPTRILIGISSFLLHNGILVAIAIAALIFGFLRGIKTHTGKKIWHAVILHTPIIGTIIKKINLARFSRTLHSLLQTDIPIVQSFQIIERTLGNVYYQMAMEEASQLLKKGISVVEALKKYPKLFPPMVSQMIAVGEQSGTLDDLANEIAIFYEEDVDETMTNFSAIIEPLLLVILGVAVGGMAIAVLLPMYSLTEQV